LTLYFLQQLDFVPHASFLEAFFMYSNYVTCVRDSTGNKSLTTEKCLS
jgi:hypothetical protein